MLALGEAWRGLDRRTRPWHDPITLKTSIEIAESTVLRRAYADAPVSNLYLWDLKEDLHPQLEGKNGGGDPWRTDGRLAIVTIRGGTQGAQIQAK